MIHWTDFYWDDVLGAVQTVPKDWKFSNRRMDSGGDKSVMEDAITIQETREKNRPARKVGQIHLDSVDTGTEASLSSQINLRRVGGA